MSPALTPEDIAAGWVAWEGGECPVPAETLAEVRFRDGYFSSGEEAGGWDWYRSGGPDDIIAYRALRPATPAPDPLADLQAENAELREALTKLVDEFGGSLDQLRRNGPDLSCADGEFVAASVLEDRADAIKAALDALSRARGETTGGHSHG